MICEAVARMPCAAARPHYDAPRSLGNGLRAVIGFLDNRLRRIPSFGNRAGNSARADADRHHEHYAQPQPN
jgi:hypothetical protein